MNPGRPVLKPGRWAAIPGLSFSALVVIASIELKPSHTRRLCFCNWGEIGQSNLEFPTRGSRGLGRRQEMLCQGDGGGGWERSRET